MSETRKFPPPRNESGVRSSGETVGDKNDGMALVDGFVSGETPHGSDEVLRTRVSPGELPCKLCCEAEGSPVSSHIESEAKYAGFHRGDTIWFKRTTGWWMVINFGRVRAFQLSSWWFAITGV